MSVRTLWQLVAVVWLGVCLMDGAGFWFFAAGLAACVVFAAVGFLANPRKGIHR